MAIDKIRWVFVPACSIFVTWMTSGGALLEADTHSPELVTPQRHSGSVDALQVSHDGKWFVTAGSDRTVRIWSLPLLGHLRSFAIPGSAIRALALHPVEPWVAIGQDDGIQMWDVRTGRKVNEFKDNEFVAGLAWSPDGTRLASSGAQLRVFTSSLHELWTSAGPRIDIGRPVGHDLVFSKDGRRLFVTGYQNNVTVWDANNGGGIASLSGATTPVLCLALSPDGKILFAGAADGVLAFNVETSNSTGPLRSTPEPVIALAATGTALFGIWREAGDFPAKQGIRAWTTDSSAEARDVPREEQDLTEYRSLGVAAEGDILLAGSQFGEIQSWGASTLRASTKLEANHTEITPGFTADGQLRLKLGNVGDYIEVNRQVRAESVVLSDLDFLGNCRFFLNGSRLFCSAGDASARSDTRRDSLAIYDTGSLAQLEKISGDGMITKVAVSAAGEFAAWYEQLIDLRKPNDHAAYLTLWNLTKKIRIARVEIGPQETVTNLQFSPNAQILAVSMSNGQTTLMEASTGHMINILKVDARPNRYHLLSPFVFSPDERLALTGDDQGGLALWDLRSGGIQQMMAHEGKVTALIFSADGKSFFSAGEDRKILLWTISKEGEIRKEEFANLENSAAHLELHPTQPLLVASDDVGSIFVWNLESRKMAATMRVDCSRKPCRWMVAAPDGLFESSDDNWRELAWRFDGDTFSTLPVSTYFVDYFRPNLLARMLKGEHLAAPIELSKLDRRQHAAALVVSRIGGLPKATARLTFTPASKTSDVRDAKLFRNGMLAAKWPGRLTPKADGTVHIETTIPLAPGRNEFRAVAYNQSNVASQEALADIELPQSEERGPSLHILAVGIDKYADARLTLKYAVADSHLLTSTMRNFQGESWQYRSVEVTELSDENATKERILAAVLQLTATASVEDDVIIFFSGHGYSKGERFYVVTHEYDGRQRGLISDQDFERILLPLQMRNAVLVLDTCDSGQVVESRPASPVIGPVNQGGFAQLAYEKHIQILAASQAFQAALEIDSYGHGVLTQALVQEGLAEFKADRKPKDGLLTWFEWLDYASERVPQLEQGWAESQRGIVLPWRNGSLRQTPTILFREEEGMEVSGWLRGDPITQSGSSTVPALLKKYIGTHPTILLFWVPNVASTIQMLENAEAVRDKNPFFDVIGVAIGPQGSIDEVHIEHDLHVPLVRDPDGKSFEDLGVCAPGCFLPYLIALDSDGYIVARVKGYRSRDTLTEILKSTFVKNGEKKP
jgi:WD40 repeat protein